MSDLVRSCCANVALTTAIAMTATAVYPAAQASALQADRAAYSVVNVPVLTLASLESSLGAVDSAPAQPAIMAVGSQRDATQAIDSAAAEATNPGDILDGIARGAANALYDIARGVAIAAGVALLPLWWIGFPVTFPLGWQIASDVLYPNIWMDPLGIAAYLKLGTAIFLPVVLIRDFLIPARGSSATTASPSASTARSSAASTISLSDTPTVLAGEPAIEIDRDNSESVKRAAPRSKRPAESAAATSPSTEAALKKRDDVPSVSKENAASPRNAGGRNGARNETTQRP